MGGLRLIFGIDSYSNLTKLESTIKNSSYAYTSSELDIIKYITNVTPLLFIELAFVATILILDIALLCVEREIDDNLPHEKSRKICIGILIIAIIYLLIEIGVYCSMPSGISEQITAISIISSLGFVIVLIVFCALGLKTETEWPENEIIITKAPTVEKTELTPLDMEIAELKKQIEKRKLEIEFAQLEAEKQTEIEKLKKELEELK